MKSLRRICNEGKLGQLNHKVDYMQEIIQSFTLTAEVATPEQYFVAAHLPQKSMQNEAWTLPGFAIDPRLENVWTD